jgi:hypothetical protein
MGHPEPTAYEPAYRRMLQFYLKGIEAAYRAEGVADTVRDILTDPKAPFRTSCAWGGPELCEGRRAISDADWIELGEAEDDDAYYDRFQALFGLDLRTDAG